MKARRKAPAPPRIDAATTIGEVVERRCPGLEVGPAGYTWDELVLAVGKLTEDATFDLTTANHEKSRRPLLVALVALSHDALDAFDRRYKTGGAR